MTQTGGSQPALAARVGHPRRGEELGRGQKQRKAFIPYKHSLPPHHKQDQTTPSRVFPSDYQLSTTDGCRNQASPKDPSFLGEGGRLVKTPTTRARSEQGEASLAPPAGAAAVAGPAQTHTVISISFLEQSKTDAKNQPVPCQLLAPTAPFPARLHAEPNGINAAFY